MNTTRLESVVPGSPPEPLAVLAARAASALEHSIQRFVLAGDQDLGHPERQAAHAVLELLRQAAERAAQAKADGAPPRCPACQQPLARLSAEHPRTFQTRFGSITIRRTRGSCKRCRKWRVPADALLGLEASAGYSTGVQEAAALPSVAIAGHGHADVVDETSQKGELGFG